MRIRRRCVKHGHKWWDWEISLPFQFCERWGCDGERVNPDYPMPDELRELFEQYLNKKMREEIKDGPHHGKEG
jgi:hypothetical protein